MAANSVTYDLAMLVRRMANRLLISRKYAAQDTELAMKALDYLKRNGFDGSVMREKGENRG